MAGIAKRALLRMAETWHGWVRFLREVDVGLLLEVDWAMIFKIFQVFTEYTGFRMMFMGLNNRENYNFQRSVGLGWGFNSHNFLRSMGFHGWLNRELLW